MTETLLTNVKILLGINSNEHDSLIKLLIRRNIDYVKSYCNQSWAEEEEFPAEILGVVEELTVLRFQQRGYEGKTSERLGDYAVTFGEMGDLPQTLRNRLNKYRVMRIY